MTRLRWMRVTPSNSAASVWLNGLILGGFGGMTRFGGNAFGPGLAIMKSDEINQQLTTLAKVTLEQRALLQIILDELVIVHSLVCALTMKVGDATTTQVAEIHVAEIRSRLAKVMEAEGLSLSPTISDEIAPTGEQPPAALN